MKKCLLLVVLLVGCAQQPIQQPAKPISNQDWQQLQLLLQAAPAEIADAIAQQVKPDLVDDNQATGPVTSKALLRQILLTTNNPLLLADSAFYQAQSVVSGKQAHSFAQTLSDFLTQPNFNCSQPIYARYLQTRYQIKPALSSCNKKLPFFVVDRYKGGDTLWLAPERVREIHLLFAGEGENLSSRFGHVALRLVVCPEGLFEQASCDSNLYQHIVLGYMAHIDEFELDTFKALTGSYNAYLFAFPFVDVYRDYAISEFREVYSLPLQLNQQQRAQMLKELAEVHWRFSGNYSFFSQNCASLLQQALQLHIPEMLADPQLSEQFIRPDHLFAAAKKSQLTAGNKLASLQLAEQQGYYFSSTKPFYNKALMLVENAMSNPEFTDLDGYLQIKPSRRLQNILQDRDYVALIKAQKNLLEAQLLLEELAFVRSERLLMAEGSRYFQHLDNQAKVEKIYSQLNAQQAELFDNCLLKPVKQITEPVLRLSGIPKQTEIPPVRSPAQCQSKQQRKQLAQLLAIVNIEQQDKLQWQRVLNASQLIKLNMENIAALNAL